MNLFYYFCSFLPCFVLGLPKYKLAMPNGDYVPNPCSPGDAWEAVGHTRSTEGSRATLNQFAKDFAAVGNQWTTSLCRKDSDGDGRSNGDELGDPQCKWTKNNAGRQRLDNTNLGHPGICEPITSATCKSKNSFLNEQNCDILSPNFGQQETTTIADDDNDMTTTTEATTTRRNGRNSNSSDWVHRDKCSCYCRAKTTPDQRRDLESALYRFLLDLLTTVPQFNNNNNGEHYTSPCVCNCQN